MQPRPYCTETAGYLFRLAHLNPGPDNDPGERLVSALRPACRMQRGRPSWRGSSSSPSLITLVCRCDNLVCVLAPLIDCTVAQRPRFDHPRQLCLHYSRRWCGYVPDDSCAESSAGRQLSSSVTRMPTVVAHASYRLRRRSDLGSR